MKTIPPTTFPQPHDKTQLAKSIPHVIPHKLFPLGRTPPHGLVGNLVNLEQLLCPKIPELSDPIFETKSTMFLSATKKSHNPVDITNISLIGQTLPLYRSSQQTSAFTMYTGSGI